MPTGHDPVSPPVAGIERFTDFDELARFYAGWRVGVEQLSTGRFEGSVQLTRSRSLYAVEGWFSQSVTVRGSCNPAETGFILVEPVSGPAAWWGRRQEAGRLITVARRWGFHHLGHFAVDYRRAFGESPSDTVGPRRPRGPAAATAAGG